MRRLRLVPLLAIAAFACLAALVLLAPPAQAAVTIGDVEFGSGQSCSTPTGMVQDVPQTGKTYVIPSDGVITSFSFSGAGGGLGAITQTKLLVLERLDASAYRVAAASQTETVDSEFLVIRLTRVPVSAGQTIGSYGYSCSAQPAGAGMIRTFNGPEPAVGSTQPFPSLNPARMVLAATIEPDCDFDGFGDETQDPNTSSCRPATTACKGKPATIVGTSGNDVRKGTSGNDVIAGLGGNDKLSGLAGNDLICGGSGKDTLNGGKGNDKLYGQKGKDTLKGAPGKDKLKGGAGKDKQVQ